LKKIRDLKNVQQKHKALKIATRMTSEPVALLFGS